MSSTNPSDGPFPLRWGNQEPIDADRVPFLPRWLINGDPCCFKTGVTVRLSLRQDAPDPIHGWVVEWGVGYLTLYSRVTGQVLRTYPDAYFLTANQPYDFGPLVEWIEYAQLGMAVYVVYESGWVEEDYHGFVDEMFIVLDAPKSPMDPAWVSVLRISCQWARGESTSGGAAISLTQKLWENGNYNGGYPGYIRYFRDPNGLPVDDREIFYLKAFLNHPWFPYGQCNDFADFLICLMTSVGVPIDKARRTHQLLLTDDTNFRTNWITPAGQSPTKAEWTYHQFVFTDQVWDGCLTLGEYGNFIIGMEFNGYKTGLVEVILRYDWQSTPPSGWFIPEISAVPADQIPPWPWAN